MNRISIRTARIGDAARLAEIYAPYVERTSITFEYSVPTVGEFERRISNTLCKYPYLVAETEDGTVVGYAYAGPLKMREAYSWAVELSVYVDGDFRRCRIGSVLYGKLVEYLKAQNITNLYACITYSDIEDELHNNDSVRFHARMGFAKNAHFHNCGYKFGRWWDMIWMEKFIAPHKGDMMDFVPFPQLGTK